jgi:hypothetical protein
MPPRVTVGHLLEVQPAARMSYAALGYLLPEDTGGRSSISGVITGVKMVAFGS